MSSPPVIELRSLSKRYPSAKRWALENLDLHVAPSESLALMGPMGSGKTTLLKILATLVAPTSGVINLFGHPWQKGSAFRHRLGWLGTDERSFYWRLSGRENLQFFAALQGMPRRTATERIADLERRLGFSAFIDLPFARYSTGMRQTLALSRAILHKPDLLLLDEPMRGLDTKTSREAHGLLREYASSTGKALVFSTHDEETARVLAGRVVRLDAGRIAEEGDRP